jgi:hypothetical protein
VIDVGGINWFLIITILLSLGSADFKIVPIGSGRRNAGGGMFVRVDLTPFAVVGDHRLDKVPPQVRESLVHIHANL